MRPEATFLELVHRLDRDTSGVLLVAKKRSRADRAARADARRATMDKRYLARVEGRFRNETQRVRRRCTSASTREGEKRVSRVGRRARRPRPIFRRVARGARAAACSRPSSSPGARTRSACTSRTSGTRSLGDDKYGDFELNKRAAQARA